MPSIQIDCKPMPDRRESPEAPPDERWSHEQANPVAWRRREPSRCSPWPPISYPDMMADDMLAVDGLLVSARNTIRERSRLGGTSNEHIGVDHGLEPLSLH